MEVKKKKKVSFGKILLVICFIDVTAHTGPEKFTEILVERAFLKCDFELGGKAEPVSVLKQASDVIFVKISWSMVLE